MRKGLISVTLLSVLILGACDSSEDKEHYDNPSYLGDGRWMKSTMPSSEKENLDKKDEKVLLPEGVLNGDVREEFYIGMENFLVEYEEHSKALVRTTIDSHDFIARDEKEQFIEYWKGMVDSVVELEGDFQLTPETEMEKELYDFLRTMMSRKKEETLATPAKLFGEKKEKVTVALGQKFSEEAFEELNNFRKENNLNR